MSKVAIQGNASGTGTFTIAAPNSNTDRTLTLPDEAGTVLTSASSIPASSVTGLTQGITEHDIWQLTWGSGGLSSGDIIGQQSEGLQRSTLQGFEKIGTGMSYSQPTFSFPSTGYWVIRAVISYSAGGARAYVGVQIRRTTDNSSYSTASLTYSSITPGAYATARSELHTKVTDITNQKIQFRMDQANDINVYGGTNFLESYFEFIKIGDI